MISAILVLQQEWSRCRPSVTQRVGRGLALLFHDRGTRRGWVVSSKPWPHFTPGKDPVPILQEAGWASGPVWTGGKSRPHRDSIPDRPARSQSLYRLSFSVHSVARILLPNLPAQLQRKWRQLLWVTVLFLAPLAAAGCDMRCWQDDVGLHFNAPSGGIFHRATLVYKCFLFVRSKNVSP